MEIYKLNWITARRTPSLRRPTIITEEWKADMLERIWQDLHFVYRDEWLRLGFTKECVVAMLFKWMVYFIKVRGFAASLAWSAAKVNVVSTVSAAAAGIAVPALALWAGVLMLGAFYEFIEWLEGHEGSWTYTNGEVFMTYRNQLWLGGVIGHPEARVWDFQMCRLVENLVWVQRALWSGRVLVLNTLFFRDLWQFLEKGLVFWYVFAIHQAETKWLGLAHRLGWGRYRLKLYPDWPEPWNFPVGWGRRESEACEGWEDMPGKFEPVQY